MPKGIVEQGFSVQIYDSENFRECQKSKQSFEELNLKKIKRENHFLVLSFL